MDKALRNRILIILGTIVASIYFAFPLEKRINLGLDLKGGMHLILRVETEKLSGQSKEDAVLKTIEVLRNRIDNLGVGETVIQRQGESEILVQLPGVTDRDTAMSMVGRVAQLEFRIVDDDPNRLKAATEGKVPDGFILKNIKKESNESILLDNNVALTGEAISDARVDLNSQSFGQPYISLSLNSEGSKKFGEITQKNVGRRLAIILDGEVLSAPNINEAILGGNAQITGQFTFEEASLLALALRSGALPAKIIVEEERTVGPLLGKDSIADGIRAAVLGTGLVLAFMGLYYLSSGMIANFGVLLNLLLLLGSMGFLSVMMPESKITLTLPGIAGIILTLGMAVDANVLINERIREELKLGRPLAMAVNMGYNRAFSAILDSHVTTITASFFLFQFGSGPIRGFALTLMMGLFISLFTSLYVTRTLFSIALKYGWIKSLRMLSLFPNTKFDFLSKRFLSFTFSILLTIAGIAAIIHKKDTIYGIDFVGGQIQQYRFTQPVQADELRKVMKTAGVEDAVIQQFEKDPQNVMIRTAEDSYEKVTKALKESFPNNTFETLRIEKVGPVVGKHLRQAAMWAIVMALGGILIYIAFRFKHVDFAVAGIVALFHDIFIALTVLVFMNRQVDLLVVTALLTIAGYSINDTIVVYDRIRENVGKLGKRSFYEILNISINETLGRTVLTTSVTLLVVIALYYVGGEVLNSFALCLFWGFLSGVYSTTFIATPIVLMWRNKTQAAAH